MLRATFSRFGFVSSASGLEAAYVHIIEVGLDWIAGVGLVTDTYYVQRYITVTF